MKSHKGKPVALDYRAFRGCSPVQVCMDVERTGGNGNLHLSLKPLKSAGTNTGICFPHKMTISYSGREVLPACCVYMVQTYGVRNILEENELCIPVSVRGLDSWKLDGGLFFRLVRFFPEKLQEITGVTVYADEGESGKGEPAELHPYEGPMNPESICMVQGWLEQVCDDISRIMEESRYLAEYGMTSELPMIAGIARHILTIYQPIRTMYHAGQDTQMDGFMEYVHKRMEHVFGENTLSFLETLYPTASVTEIELYLGKIIQEWTKAWSSRYSIPFDGVIPGEEVYEDEICR